MKFIWIYHSGRDVNSLIQSILNLYSSELYLDMYTYFSLSLQGPYFRPSVSTTLEDITEETGDIQLGQGMSSIAFKG